MESKEPIPASFSEPGSVGSLTKVEHGIGVGYNILVLGSILVLVIMYSPHRLYQAYTELIGAMHLASWKHARRTLRA